MQLPDGSNDGNDDGDDDGINGNNSGSQSQSLDESDNEDNNNVETAAEASIDVDDTCSEYENNDNDVEAMLLNNDSIREVQDILCSSGLVNYLEGKLYKKANDVQTLTMRVASFLCWVDVTQHAAPYRLDAHNVMQYFTEIVIEHFEVLHKYSMYLQGEKDFTASTIKNYMSDIGVSGKWLIYYYSKEHKQQHNGSKINPGDCELFLQEIKDISRVQLRRDIKRRSTKNMADCIAERRQPPRGISQLQEAVCSDLPWALSVKSHVLDKHIYNKFRQLLYASLWAGNLNR